MKNVLITRQAEQSVEFVNLLSFNGFYPFILPLIQTIPVKFNTKYKNYDFIVFPSVNSVKYFFQNKNDIKFKYVVAVGKKTSEYLQSMNIKVDFIPEKYSAKGMIELFKNKDIENNTFLLPGPEKRKNEFYEFLSKNKIYAELLTVYKTIKVQYDTGYIDNFIKENKIEIITFASPSAAESFFMQIINKNLNVQYISIGTTTYDYLIKIGIDSIHPEHFTVNSMVKLIKEKFGN